MKWQYFIEQYPVFDRVSRVQRLAVSLGVFAFSTLAGCASNQATSVPTDPNNPALIQWSPSNARLVGDRYLLLPLELPPNNRGFMAGSFMISGGSWSGGGYASYSGGWCTNLEIVDLQTGNHHRIFDSPAAIGPWAASSFTANPSQLIYENLLILPARTADANADKRLDGDDPMWIFLYDLSNQSLLRASPEAFIVDRFITTADAILMILRNYQAPKQIAVYVYEVKTRSGRFVADGLRP